MDSPDKTAAVSSISNLSHRLKLELSIPQSSPAVLISDSSTDNRHAISVGLGLDWLSWKYSDYLLKQLIDSLNFHYSSVTLLAWSWQRPTYTKLEQRTRARDLLLSYLAPFYSSWSATSCRAHKINLKVQLHCTCKVDKYAYKILINNSVFNTPGADSNRSASLKIIVKI